MSIILAFSGGLDTSFCVPFLSETLKTDVITVTVNTGGFSADELISIQEKSAKLGAAHHVTVDAREQLFTDHVAYLIKGNMMRGSTYPICVGPERVVQAQELVKQARLFGADTLAHGSTGAGNDQVRFDVALSVLAGDMKLLAPIREHSIDRSFASEFLTSRGFPPSRLAPMHAPGPARTGYLPPLRDPRAPGTGTTCHRSERRRHRSIAVLSG